MRTPKFLHNETLCLGVAFDVEFKNEGSFAHKLNFDPNSGHLRLHLPESGSKLIFSESMTSFLNSALKVTPGYQVSLIFDNFQFLYHRKCLQMNQKLLVAVNHLSVTELK